ncbi:DUF1127 domain-containing protein [Bradyrhizobium sp. INPA03-11B]|uniref:DUF1127 domain-containing protein n=1 Tax=Bradyrhizobium sp. INPA03-11B TaxID=418598 RepID=UPI00338FAEA1
MSTTYIATGWDRPFAFARRVVSFLEGHCEAFQERRKSARLRTTLSGLSDSELTDIGISRGEIEYVASNRAMDPRSAVCPP